MKVLIIGNGAREHAIAWKLRENPRITDLLVAPGNAGTSEIACNVPIRADDIVGLADLVGEQSVGFTVVGPEAPLAAGIVDRFQQAGHIIFGPTSAAARIETSKIFAKELMLATGVPTAGFETFSSFDEAIGYLAHVQLPIVVKVDGLAAGKGVFVCTDSEQAEEALDRILVRKEFGSAGDRVLIEECLEGVEISVFSFVDGRTVSPMVAARDYKRAHDGDRGPNTGGMGSFSPPPEWNTGLERRIRTEAIEPIVRGLAASGSPYSGMLYTGLMLTTDGPKVLEFNCRLGDPETQVTLPRLKSDLLDVMMESTKGRLGRTSIEWDDRACVGVVLASDGYPGKYRIGHTISGLDAVDADAFVFQAGTRLSGDEVVTDGGRVLTVVALGRNLTDARGTAYENVNRIDFDGAFSRGDIAEFCGDSK